MEASSQPPSAPARSLPDGVNPEALYDGPNVHRLASGRGAFVSGLGTNSAPGAAGQHSMAGDGAQAFVPTPQALIQPIGQASFPPSPPAPVPVSQSVMKRDYPQVIALAMDVLS